MYDVSKLLTPELVDLRSKFVQEGFDIRFVGGCVRDLLHKSEPKDTDLCTDATPDEQIEIYKKYNFRYVETGLQHGTITVVINSITYEITSLRTDVACDGRHAEVAFTKNWTEDLARRDFTINAMSLDFDGNLLDPFNGIEDLSNRLVKFVGDPNERIKEDYLRILRWYRFRGRFNATHMHMPDWEAVQKHAAGLEQISKERIWMEFSKIISGPNGPTIVDQMMKDNVMSPAGLPSYYGVQQSPFIKGEDRLARVYEITRNPITLMIAAFYGRAIPNLEELKVSSDEIRLARWLNLECEKHHLSPTRYMAIDGISREWAIELAALRDMNLFDRMIIAEWDAPVFPINGNDLLQSGIPAGPKLGRVLRDLKYKWADSTYTMSKEDLLEQSNKSLNSLRDIPEKFRF